MRTRRSEPLGDKEAVVVLRHKVSQERPPPRDLLEFLLMDDLQPLLPPERERY